MAGDIVNVNVLYDTTLEPAGVGPRITVLVPAA